MSSVVAMPRAQEEAENLLIGLEVAHEKLAHVENGGDSTPTVELKPSHIRKAVRRI